MTINEWSKHIHNWARRKGWWTPPSDSAKIHLNIISEIVEASEEVRNNNPELYIKNRKPEGEQIELADAVIRIMDYFGYKNWDLESTIKLKMSYNETRPYRHGNKKY